MHVAIEAVHYDCESFCIAGCFTCHYDMLCHNGMLHNRHSWFSWRICHYDMLCHNGFDVC